MVVRVTRSPGGVFRRSAGGVRGISAPLVFGTAYYHGSCVLSDVFYMWKDGLVYYSENFGGTWSVLEDAAALDETYAYTVVSDTLYTTQTVSGSDSTFHTTTDCTSLTAVGAPNIGFVAQNDIRLNVFNDSIPAGTYDGTWDWADEYSYRLDAVTPSYHKRVAYFDSKFWAIDQTGSTVPSVAGEDRFGVAPSGLSNVWSSYETSRTWLRRTSNGTYWTFAQSSWPYKDTMSFCVHDNKLFGISTEGGTAGLRGCYTTNGLTETSIATAITPTPSDSSIIGIPNCISYNGNIYVIPYYAARVDYIPKVGIYDGSSWDVANMVGVHVDTIDPCKYNGFIYDGKIFITRWDVNGSEVYLHAYYSTDGENWTHA